MCPMRLALLSYIRYIALLVANRISDIDCTSLAIVKCVLNLFSYINAVD